MEPTITIEEQKQHIAKITKLGEKLHNAELNNSTDYQLTSDDINTIQRALACHMAVITLDYKSREQAIENGSEDGDLSSQSEENIIKACIGIIHNLVDDFKSWYQYINGEDSIANMDEDEKFEFETTYFQLVQKLLLSHTHHAGGTSTRAKCRTLGFDPYETISFQWKDE